MIIVVMGVSGSGKSTVGRALADRLGWIFLDADELHPPENRAKMEGGIPLEETDREPWLEQIASRIMEAHTEGENLIVACSALRRGHRERMREAAPVRFIYLAGEAGLIAGRLVNRRGHFMPPALLGSQLEILEPPEGEPGVLTLDAVQPVAALVDAAVHFAIS